MTFSFEKASKKGYQYLFDEGFLVTDIIGIQIEMWLVILVQVRNYLFA
jgi:hypothetical protein